MLAPILIHGCTSFSNQPIVNKGDLKAYPDLSQKKYCRGKGYVVSQGNMQGRLNFTFTSSKESSYIEFRDLIGRKTLFLIFSTSKVEAWDIRNNRKYDKESLLILFPFFEIIDSNDLIAFLWGKIPETFSDPGNIANKRQMTNGEIQFSSAPTQNGMLINSVLFKLIDENETFNLRVENREFDLQYPHLIRKIPKSVMPIKESL